MEPAPLHTIARPIEYLLSGISSTSAIITRFIRFVRVAHTDLAAVTRDLSDLRLLLELLREESAIPEPLQGQMLLVLESCGSTLIYIDSILARSSEPAKWLGSGRTEIAACRRSLGHFRAALELALDVASLSALRGSPADTAHHRYKVIATIRRLQTEASSELHDSDSIEAALFSYLDTASRCILDPYESAESGANEPQEQPPTPASGKSKLEAMGPSKGEQADTEPEQRDPKLHHEVGVRPRPGNIIVPYFTEELAPVCSVPEERQSSPGLPESPTLPGRPSPVAQHSNPPPSSQPPYKQSDCFSTRPVPTPLPRHSQSDTPFEPLDPWREPSQDSKDGYCESKEAERITSFSSHRSGGSSSGSIQLSVFNMSPVSDRHSGSLSPSLALPGAYTPTPLSPFPSSPPPEYRRTWINPPPSAVQHAVPVPSRKSPHQSRVKIIPQRHLTDSKGKSSEILHLDVSPTCCYVATKHSNKSVKIWSTAKNALHGTIKATSYVQPRVRSREYFIRSHAILSEIAALIAITTHFGLILEIYNFAKGGSGAKKIQVIEEVHRWAASKLDAMHNNYAGLAIYRPKFDRIDRYFLARNPAAKNPFREDPNHSIELHKADLPFLPKFPELAFSSDSPLLVAAAGPRPGDPPRPHSVILVAWHTKPVSDGKLHAQTPQQSSTSLPDEERHKPYRVCVPDHPALQTALPACLAVHGTTAVSIWIPAASPSHPVPHRSSSPSSSNPFAAISHSPLSSAASTTTLTTSTIPTNPTTRRPSHPHPSPQPPASHAPDRLVLVWDIPRNRTRLFAIPAHAHVCSISPDCRRVAYRDAATGAFAIVEICADRGGGGGGGGTAADDEEEEVWRSPDAARAAREGFASFGGQFEVPAVGEVEAEAEAGPGERTGLLRSSGSTSSGGSSANNNNNSSSSSIKNNTGKNSSSGGGGGGGSGNNAVTAFEFSADGRALVVGDARGTVGVYEVREAAPRFELGVGSEVALADVLEREMALVRNR